MPSTIPARGARAGLGAAALGIRGREEYVAFARGAVDVGYDALVYDLLSNCEFEREEDCRATVDLLSRMPQADEQELARILAAAEEG